MDAKEIAVNLGVMFMEYAHKLRAVNPLEEAESIIASALAAQSAIMPISGKTKAQERDDIAIHMEMLCTDEMRADAYADAKAHDLPFQIFRILGGYNRALERLSAQSADIERMRNHIERAKVFFRSLSTAPEGYEELQAALIPPDAKEVER